MAQLELYIQAHFLCDFPKPKYIQKGKRKVKKEERRKLWPSLCDTSLWGDLILLKPLPCAFLYRGKGETQ